ncbi:uncharacterized protein LTR77_006197 [Saxophila tyrrhenica]|uniref:Protein kinase domain-containing protein n=1 Tax=Saxophila tyrrhenica TaxID=1690608 RepID=A0AAV9P823_9PEZI|nr:hypothetical protein LTR77_006197 [Saxophila tyrrhenica]
MDYESGNGSQFSFRTVESPPDEHGRVSEYTSVSAYVDNVAYTGKLDQHPDEVDEGELLNSLEPVPVECIHPLFQQEFTKAPPYDPEVHYLKSPSFTYDDCQPGKTFVAECVLNEVKALELIRKHPHPNLVKYYGCVVRDGRITALCLHRYPDTMVDYAYCGISGARASMFAYNIENGIHHLHSLGLAHNDINESNICVDEHEQAVIVDFDSCLPFGEPLMKGTSACADLDAWVSSKENDLDYGLTTIEEFLPVETRKQKADAEAEMADELSS